ncbi:hypothetical protein C8J56DRAFT_879968 [Mycena floridula]|nr:hypothetical protein C8J56DRAFT_879968 [Mycena floridula]
MLYIAFGEWFLHYRGSSKTCGKRKPAHSDSVESMPWDPADALDADRRRNPGSDPSNADDEEDDEDEEDQLASGDDLPTPKKRSRGRPRGSSALKRAKVDEEKKDRSITIYVQIFTPDQMKKAKPGKPLLNDFFVLGADEEWDTFTAQTMAIPRYSSEPIILDSSKYSHLVQTALRSKTDVKAKLIVEPVKTLILNKPDKENTKPASQTDGEVDSDGDGKNMKGKRKSKVPKATAIAPGNKLLNDTIGTLRERWKCPKEGKGRCQSEFCFVPAEGNDHFPLNLARQENWSAAILKGDNYATLDRPPNNSTFDDLHMPTKQGPSILQQRIAARNQPPPSTAPIINNHMNCFPDLSRDPVFHFFEYLHHGLTNETKRKRTNETVTESSEKRTKRT